MAVIAAMAMAGCSAAAKEPTGTSSAPISWIGPDYDTTPTIPGVAYNETSSAVIQTTTGTNIVTGTNKSADQYDGAWTSAPAPGTQWSEHAQLDAGYGWGTPPEPPTNGDTYLGPRSDPSVVSVGWPGVAVYSMMASTSHSWDVDVVLASSVDGGAHFGNLSGGDVHLVTSSSASPSGCNTGYHVDQPVMAADPSTHDVFVWWRQESANGPCPPKAWLRRATVASNGQMTLDPNTYDVTQLAGVDLQAAGSAYLAVAPSYSDPGRGPVPQTVYLAFPDTWTGGNCNSTTSMTWWLAYSQNQGATFTPAASPVAQDPSWPYCIAPLAAQNVQNRNRPQLAWDAVHDELMMTMVQTGYKQGNIAVGTRAYLYQTSDNGGSWQRWVTSCLPCSDPTAPCHQLVNGLLPANEPTCYQFGAALATVATASGGWAFFDWYDTEDSPTDDQVDVRGATVVPGLPQDGNEFHFKISSGPPWSTPANALFLPYGDYDGVAGDPSDGSFHAVWADYRDQGSTAGAPEVWSAQVFP